MRKVFAVLGVLLILALEIYVIGCGNTPIDYRTSSEGPTTGYANIFSNGHGIIYATFEDAEANSQGRIAFKIITYNRGDKK